MNRPFLLIIISSLCIAAQPLKISLLLTWDHHLIQQGEWWRIVTGNFTHTNLHHLAMNLAALWLMVGMFTLSVAKTFGCLVWCSGFIGLTLLGYDLDRYVGLSGVLHGLFLYASLTELLQGRRSSLLFVGAIVLKVGWEQWQGAASDIEQLIEAPVATEAHLLGLIGAISLACIDKWVAYHRQHKQKTTP